MQTVKAFTVYDSKAETFGPPFYFKTTNEATRGIAEAVNDPQSQFSKYPADYTFFEIGSFDTDTGTLHPAEHKTNLGTALELQKLQ